jgi:hypothetical protein
MAKGGDVFVLSMGRPVRIDDLARHMINLMGLTVRDGVHPDGDIEIVYTGLRSAEKLFEELLIGDNVAATDHTMIMRAIEHSLRGRACISCLKSLPSPLRLSTAVTRWCFSARRSLNTGRQWSCVTTFGLVGSGRRSATARSLT